MIKKASAIAMALLLAAAMLMITTLDKESGNMITGLLVSEPLAPIEEMNSTYTVSPSFEVATDYSIDEFTNVVASAKGLLASCRGADEAAVEACVISQLAIKENWNINGRSGFIYRFDVASEYSLPEYDPSAKLIEDKKIVYRFALDFSDS